jgi:hypothetical protein
VNKGDFPPGNPCDGCDLACPGCPNDYAYARTLFEGKHNIIKKKSPIEEMAEHVQNALLRHGFVIQRYDAMSTSSIYFKLDYGVAHSIRISDHRGKEHLHYRYNLLTTCNHTYTDTSGKFPRKFFPFEQVQAMLNDIITIKRVKISKEGMNSYNLEMRQKFDSNRNSPGFWSKAKIIHK